MGVSARISVGEGVGKRIAEVGVASTLAVGAGIGSCGLAVEVGGIKTLVGISALTADGSDGSDEMIVAVGAIAGRGSVASSEHAMTDAQMRKHSKSAELEIGRLSNFKLDSQKGKWHQASHPIAQGHV